MSSKFARIRSTKMTMTRRGRVIFRHIHEIESLPQSHGSRRRRRHEDRVHEKGMEFTNKNTHKDIG